MQTFVGSRDCTKIFKPQLGHFSEKRFETIENLQYVMIRQIYFLAISMLWKKYNELLMNVRNFEKIDYQVQKIFCQNDDAGHLFRI